MSSGLGAEGTARRRRRVRLLQRYLLNPWTKVAARVGFPSGNVLVETTGRRSGKRRRNVVGMHVDSQTDPLRLPRRVGDGSAADVDRA